MPTENTKQEQEELLNLTRELLRIAKEALLLRSIESNILANPKLDEEDREWYRSEGFRIETEIRDVLWRGNKFEGTKPNSATG